MVCRRGPNLTVVEHYVNKAYSSSVIDPSEPSLGLTNASIITDDKFTLCSFIRLNSHNHSDYFDLNKNMPYFILAFGAGSGNSTVFS